MDSVEEGDEADASEEPCRYYTCDSNLSDQFVCTRLEKSAACKTRLESQFLRERGNAQSTCVLLYVSGRIEKFMFDHHASVDSCNASCSCETSAATTHTSSSYTETTTLWPTSTETASSTTTTAATAAATTTATTTTLFITRYTSEDMSNATIGISESKNESSVNENESIENMGSNDTLLGNDNNETSLSDGVIAAIVTVVGVCLIAVVIVLLFCKFRWRNNTRQLADDIEMDKVPHRRPSGELAAVQDSEASSRLLGTKGSESSRTTKDITENAETRFVTVQEGSV